MSEKEIDEKKVEHLISIFNKLDYYYKDLEEAKTVDQIAHAILDTIRGAVFLGLTDGKAEIMELTSWHGSYLALKEIITRNAELVA